MTLALATRVVDDDDLAVAAGHHRVAALALHAAQALELHRTGEARVELRLLRLAHGRATDVERAHGQLRTGLTDGLRGDDTHRLTHRDLAAAGEIAPVALHADAATGLTGQPRADLHVVEARVDHLLHAVLVDLLVGPHQHLAGDRVMDVVERHATEDALVERLDLLAALDERGHHDAVERTAVVLVDDGVLRDVDQTAREVTRVRGLERGVGQTLARAVRRDEVLQHREPLAEVRGDGVLDDLA